MDKKFSKLENGYFNTLGKTLHQPILMLLMLAIAIVALVQLSEKVPSEFVPKEDRGNLFILMNAQEGASFESNAKNLEKIESILMPYRESGKINRLLVRTPGFGGNAGIAIVVCSWDERDFSTFRSWMKSAPNSTACLTFVRLPSCAAGFLERPRPSWQFVLQGDTYENLVEWRDIVLQKAAQNPRLIRLDSDYKETSPQLLVN